MFAMVGSLEVCSPKRVKTRPEDMPGHYISTEVDLLLPW